MPIGKSAGAISGSVRNKVLKSDSVPYGTLGRIRILFRTEQNPEMEFCSVRNINLARSVQTQFPEQPAHAFDLATKRHKRTATIFQMAIGRLLWVAEIWETRAREEKGDHYATFHRAGTASVAKWVRGGRANRRLVPLTFLERLRVGLPPFWGDLGWRGPTGVSVSAVADRPGFHSNPGI
jgi:hypothetical protein